MTVRHREQALAEMLDREEIRGVLTDLARGTDRLDADLIRSCYHPDAIDDHAEYRGGPEGFAEWVLEVLPHFATTTHFLGNMSIELDGNIAHCETYCVAHHFTRPEDAGGERDLCMGLRYVDRFERRDEGCWRIAERRCVWDWSNTIPVSAKHIFGETYVRGCRGPADPSYERGEERSGGA